MSKKKKPVPGIGTTGVAVSRRGVGLATMAFALLLATEVYGDVRKRVFNEDMKYGPCKGDVEECAQGQRSSRDFGIVVNPKQDYTLDKIWLRVRRYDGSGAKDLTVLSQNVIAAEFALIEFEQLDVAEKLGLTRSQLQDQGFQVRPKIQSLGAGSGRQDKCPVLSFTYDSMNEDWRWKKGSSASTDTILDTTMVGRNWVAIFRTKGGVNDVGCAFVKATD